MVYSTVAITVTPSLHQPQNIIHACRPAADASSLDRPTLQLQDAYFVLCRELVRLRCWVSTYTYIYWWYNQW